MARVHSEYLVQSFFFRSLEARPEFATELEKECSFCHLDPAGGGPRNRVGEILKRTISNSPKISIWKP